MGGPGTLKVDYAELGESASSLAAIRREFEGIDDASDAVKHAVCSRDIADAIEEFANNWDRHRGELVEALGKLEEATRSAIETWQATDHKVGSSIEQTGSTQAQQIVHGHGAVHPS
ncbi:hypothetical protein [Angustibacter aerolatus]